MLAPTFQSPSWYKALTLTERLGSLPQEWDRSEVEAFNNRLASLRLERWQAQPHFQKNGFWNERLALDALSEDEFSYLLGESAAALQSRIPDLPSWLVEISAVFETANGKPIPEEWLSQAKSWQNSVMGHTVALTEPLLRWGKERFDQGLDALLQRYPASPIDRPQLETVLFTSLIQDLQRMVSRTLALELNVARLRGQLEGDTPEARFQSFLTCLSDRKFSLAVFDEYPGLARQLFLTVERWADTSLEFFERLSIDWEMICRLYSPHEDLGRLVGLNSNVGDKHRGGRSVMILQFSSGLRLVYKPRSLAVDAHFQALLEWLNARGDYAPFHTLTILDRESYGWIEFVEAGPCHSQPEIRRFYERQGGYLALLYALEATDFHFENLIAAGEHPILIDLESLFHPYVHDVTEKRPINQTISHSVLRVGLLPRRLWANKESDGIDMSGLGAKGGQLTPYPMPTWDGVGTDEMRFVRKRVEMPGGLNLPKIGEQEVNVLDYGEALVEGFAAVYRTLMTHLDELLSDTGPLAAFAGDEVRVILRPTFVYAKLYSESFHPDVLRDGLDRDRLFDHLWAGIDQDTKMRQVIPAERHDLHHGDIPMFTTRPNSRSIWSSTGQRLDDFCRESGLTLVQRRLRRLNETDLERQTWFIRSSLATLTMGLEQIPRRSFPAEEPQFKPGRSDWLKTARAVGDRLAMLAIQDEDETTWVGLSVVEERTWSLTPLGMDLYGGLPGVALFLAYLGDVTGEKRYTELSRTTLNSIYRHLENARAYLKSVGGFEGWGGLIYLLTHLGHLWQRPDLLDEAEEMAAMLPDLILEDESLDIIGGTAGCIGALLALYQLRPTPQTLAAAVCGGDHLLARATPLEQGGGWLTPLADKPLAGFSHGAAGMAWALMELAAVSGEERFCDGALAGVAYERALFSAEAGNWPDLREFDSKPAADQPHFMSAWCHGAPGIGLSRLRMLAHHNEESMRAEITAAVQTTVREGFGGNHSLCHGDLGNLELLHEAGRWNLAAEWQSQKEYISTLIWNGIEARGWLCGVPQGLETPGLMNGLAGIGLGLLRLAEPERIPSVLVMEGVVRR